MLATLKRLIWLASPALFDRVVGPHRGQTYSIGIREGCSPFCLHDAARNPVLTRDDVTDLPAAFVADPFMVRHDDRWFMFHEVFDRTCRRGRIALAESEDGYTWRYCGVVLKEPFHLAYPFVFAWDGAMWMIPDSPGQGARLYRATTFPQGWRFERQLLGDRNLSDSTLIEHAGSWWLFAGCTDSGQGQASLRLFHAETPLGPWTEHPRSPIVEADDSHARPGGNLMGIHGRLYRLAQDGQPHYGSRLRAIEIRELSADGYEERLEEANIVLKPDGCEWNAGGMHHMNAHARPDGRWLACVDGWF